VLQNIIVDWINSPEVAARVVEVLRGKLFMAEGNIASISPPPNIKVVANLRLDEGSKSGYRFDNGVVAIPVYPDWIIRWDLKSETTMVSFMDDGRIIIEKKPNKSPVSYTMIFTVTGSTSTKGESFG